MSANDFLIFISDFWFQIMTWSEFIFVSKKLICIKWCQQEIIGNSLVSWNMEKKKEETLLYEMFYLIKYDCFIFLKQKINDRQGG